MVKEGQSVIKIILSMNKAKFYDKKVFYFVQDNQDIK